MKTKRVTQNQSDRPAKLAVRQNGEPEKDDVSGYPVYPASEDIYHKYKEEKDINPEDISMTKESYCCDERNDGRDLNDEVSGINLDVPGTELDDNQESIGSEDEENNYYSIGGDNHNDLEEYQGE